MDYMSTFLTFSKEAWESFKETIAAVRWAPTMYSKEGMSYMRTAAAFMLLANVVELAGPYFIGQLAAAHSGEEVSQFNKLLGALCAVWMGGTIIERYGNNRREKGWNLNDRALRLKLSMEWFRKTPGEVLGEDRDVGANQIETGANTLSNLQFHVFFTGTSLVATVAALTIFLIATDTRAGLAITAVLLANIIFIFYVNHAIHKEMKVIGKEMREISNQLIEYWKSHSYIVATGNEHTVLEWLKTTMKGPWRRDYFRWGIWYAIVDGIRSCATAVALVYIIYHYAWGWDTATFVAVLGWLIIYREQFWVIADTQREITRGIEKIHALKTEFSKPESFDQGAFTKERNYDVFEF